MKYEALKNFAFADDGLTVVSVLKGQIINCKSDVDFLVNAGFLKEMTQPLENKIVKNLEKTNAKKSKFNILKTEK